MIYVIYDYETYPNFFSACFQRMDTGERWIFEISVRRDDGEAMFQFLHWMIQNKISMIGYNSLNFDYPITHLFLNVGRVRRVTYTDLYDKAQAIIDSPRNDWTHMVWESDHLIPQIDLLKIMHFDNFARATSLKKLEVAMKSSSVEDLPAKPGEDLPVEMMDPMITYMTYDVDRTAAFATEIWDRIEFRQGLDAKLGGKSRINYNDTKIGKEFFMDELRKQGVQLRGPNGPMQTPRKEGIRVADIMLPIQFDTPGLQAIYQFFQGATIPADKLKGFFSKLSANVRGFQMDFGAGGIHGAVPSTTFRATDTRVIELRDVVSYYPSIAIKNGWYPEHLGEKFVEVYSDLFIRRRSHAKGTPENASLKLALNGVYGETANKYSSFFDPQYTMKVTINGQLLLARLTEVLLTVPSLEMIQINTDGVAYQCDVSDVPHIDAICKWWEDWTKLELETDRYSVFAQRDCNNYIAIEA